MLERQRETVEVTLQDLNAIDNFMFNELTMQEDKEKAKKFCRTIIEPIIGAKIRNLELVPQKTQQGATPEKHGIQMDVYIKAYMEANGEMVQDAELHIKPTIYDLEPNTYKVKMKEIIHRSRYYHAMIDKQILPRGSSYSDMDRVVVIFILTYDPFGYDRMMYTVKRHCVEEPDMPYDDGDVTYFLYAYGRKDIPSQELQDMLLFLVDSSKENAKSEELEAVRTMMDEIKHNSEVEVKYMNAMEHDRQVHCRGYEEGKVDGIEQGIERSTLTLLKAKLIKGKNIPTIAEEMETDEAEIRSLIEKYKLQDMLHAGI